MTNDNMMSIRKIFYTKMKLQFLLGCNITPNFSLQAGYDFLWVAGIATATRQFNLDDLRQNPMDAGGQTFFNGVSFGLEGSW